MRTSPPYEVIFVSTYPIVSAWPRSARFASLNDHASDFSSSNVRFVMMFLFSAPISAPMWVRSLNLSLLSLAIVMWMICCWRFVRHGSLHASWRNREYAIASYPLMCTRPGLKWMCKWPQLSS